MMCKKEIMNQIDNFIGEINDNSNHRFKSWEYCHNIFHNIFTKYNSLTEEDEDYLALHLGFYLASWGMYRGSSFLLQSYDYKIHKNAVNLACNYKQLFIIDPFTQTKGYIDLLFGKDGLYIKLYNYYLDLKTKVKSNENISMTLITKILMGIFGCIPAYDQFFIKGLRSNNISISKNCRPNIESLIEFINKNNEYKDAFIDKCNELSQDNYTIMKVADMYFWQLGKTR